MCVSLRARERERRSRAAICDRSMHYSSSLSELRVRRRAPLLQEGETRARERERHARDTSYAFCIERERKRGRERGSVNAGSEIETKMFFLPLSRLLFSLACRMHSFRRQILSHGSEVKEVQG